MPSAVVFGDDLGAMRLLEEIIRQSSREDAFLMKIENIQYLRHNSAMRYLGLLNKAETP
jgi:hypothetical protein